ncbi:MAG: hypothetical protein QOE53_236 [Pseudonocardiales bacterium]|nr:hypothetical protein [Pseudonocardiales bacterium]
MAIPTSYCLSVPTDGVAASNVRDRLFGKLLSAVLSLLFGLAILVLPPVANEQLAAAEKMLQKPLVAVVVAVALVAVSAWKLRFAVAIAGLLAVIAAVQIGYYIVTTQPGRAVATTASSWDSHPLATGAKGFAENQPDVFGRARLEWSGNSLRLNLHSETGTTQQGFYLDGGATNSSFLFTARVTKVDGGDAVTCPLLFGIKDNRSYYTFRIQALPTGGYKAIAYQIIPNTPVFTSGFHSVLLDETKALPYINHWNLVKPSERNSITLGIKAESDSYQFFVNSRQVFDRRIDGLPTHTVAVGVTVLANGLKSDAVCQYDDVSLKVKP